MVCGLFVSAMLTAHPGAAQDAIHVRTIEPTISPLIARGIGRSATFRELVRAIDSSDSYVYLKESSCGPSGRACLVAVTSAESARFAWVNVDVLRADAQPIGRIGQELRDTERPYRE